MFKPDFKAQIREDVSAIMERVIAWRRHLHQHPEISFEEFETTAFLRKELENMGCFEILQPTKTGLIAVIKGTKPGKTIALRADIDALPLQEETNLPFASQHEGKMHACGHDSHMAMLLGVAAILASQKDILVGTYKLMFQPAEELTPGGAQAFVDAGILDDVDVVLGQHVMPGIPAGHIGLLPGPMMASVDTLEFTVKGRGGHGAMPHLSIDPITIASQIINNIQLLISRETNPLDPVVASITSFHAGTAHNIIPMEAQLKGTVRTFNPTTRERVGKRLKEIAENVAIAHGASIDWNYIRGYSATINNEQVANTMISLISEKCGSHVIIPIEPIMPAEDFSAYLAKVPGCFFFLGVGNESKNCAYDLHNPKFNLDEDALALGITVMVQGAFHFAQQNT